VQAEERPADPLHLEVGHLALQTLELDRVHPRRLAAEVEDLVDLVEVEGVVQNHLMGGVLREDGLPETNLRLDRRGTREELRVWRGGNRDRAENHDG
jgi:hypothetical protein